MSEREARIKDLKAADFDGLVREVLGKGGGLRFRARGTSMRPFIRDGDVVLVEPAVPSGLKRGEIVLCRRPWGSHTVHRLVRLQSSAEGLSLITKGDNAAFCDLPIPVTEMMGRVVEIERNGRCLRLDRGTGRMFNNLVYRLSPWKPWRFSWLRWLARHPWRWVGRLMW